MTAYASIDGAIDAWVEANGLMLFTEWADRPARFVHVPGKPPFECFQISIEPPTAARVAVYARSIDTNDGAELEHSWEGSPSTLAGMLDSAIAMTTHWRERAQAG